MANITPDRFPPFPRQAWSDLGSAPRDEVISSFVLLLDKACSAFKPYIEAHKREREERRRKEQEAEANDQKEAEESLREQQRLEEEAERKAREEVKRFEDQK